MAAEPDAADAGSDGLFGMANRGCDGRMAQAGRGTADCIQKATASDVEGRGVLARRVKSAKARSEPHRNFMGYMAL